MKASYQGFESFGLDCLWVAGETSATKSHQLLSPRAWWAWVSLVSREVPPTESTAGRRADCCSLSTSGVPAATQECKQCGCALRWAQLHSASPCWCLAERRKHVNTDKHRLTPMGWEQSRCTKGTLRKKRFVARGFCARTGVSRHVGTWQLEGRCHARTSAARALNSNWDSVTFQLCLSWGSNSWLFGARDRIVIQLVVTGRLDWCVALWRNTLSLQRF